MKSDLTQRMTDDEARGAAAVLYLADELHGDGRVGFEAALRDDASVQSMLSDLRGVDGMLRANADAESPSLGELRRTRDASLRLARTRAVAMIESAAARRTGRPRRIPRWSIAAAAAALVVAGVVGWMSSAAPTSLPARASSTDGLVADTRQQWYEDWRDYADLVPAFTPVEVRPADANAGAPDSLDDGDTQVDALTMIDTMSADDGAGGNTNGGGGTSGGD